MKHTPEEIKNRLSNIGEAIGKIALDYIADLEKENAELKGLVNQYKASKCGSISLVNRNMIMFDQLTKAKEIIKYLCGMVRELNKPNVQLTNVDYSLAEAEQFLSEVEK